MTAIQVGSIAKYLVDYGTQKRPIDWSAFNFVRAAKGIEIGGYVDFNIGGKKTRYNKDNQEELAAQAFGFLGSFLDKAVDFDFEIVPVPNSDMCVQNPSGHRIINSAQMVANSSSRCVDVNTRLLWTHAKSQAHKTPGSRSPEQYEGMLSCTGVSQHPVILFDDIITSGSQMVACARALKAAGTQAMFGCTVGRTVNVQHEKMLEWHVENLEIDPVPVNFGFVPQ